MTLVRKFFGQEDPMGRQIKINLLETGPDAVKSPIFEIVGVVADAKGRIRARDIGQNSQGPPGQC